MLAAMKQDNGALFQSTAAHEQWLEEQNIRFSNESYSVFFFAAHMHLGVLADVILI
jgi:hypothetical protein